MKLRYLFSIVLSSLLVLAGCTKEEYTQSLANFEMSKTYLAIPETGGSDKATVKATEAWAFDMESCPSWLTVNPTSGAAGDGEITFSAQAVSGGREAELTIKVGELTQFVRVRQGSLEAVSATCADVIAGPDGKTFRVKGTCTSIANTTYGNWYLKDETGEIYIYGTLDAKGATKNFLSLGLEVGDVVEVEGPKTTYGSTIELVDVTVLNIVKSLVKVQTPDAELPKDGGNFEVKVTYKGEGVLVNIPENSNWISLVSMDYVQGVPTKIEPNPSDTVVVKFKADENLGGDRSGSVVFESKSGKEGSSVTYAVSQLGAVLDATIADFLAAAEGDTQYRVKGIIKSIDVNTQYHNAGIYITNGTGTEVQLYRTVAKDGNIEDLGLKVGDQITVVGKRSSYNGKPQMAAGGVVEAYEKYKTVTIAEFLAAAENDTKYSVTGQITQIASLDDNYNNVRVTITDGTNTVELYRMTTVDGAKVSTLNLEVGGTITAAGKRSSYNGTPQMAQGGVCQFYTAPTSGGDEGGEEESGEADENANYTSNVNMPAADFADSDNAAYGGVAVIGGKEYPVIKIGKSSAGGKYVLSNLPKTGDVTLSFWGVAWKAKTCALTLTVEGAKIDGADSKTIDLAANNGATGNQPYTITFAASDFYSVKLTGVTASTKVTLSTADSGPRCILTGVNVN